MNVVYGIDVPIDAIDYSDKVVADYSTNILEPEFKSIFTIQNRASREMNTLICREMGATVKRTDKVKYIQANRNFYQDSYPEVEVVEILAHNKRLVLTHNQYPIHYLIVHGYPMSIEGDPNYKVLCVDISEKMARGRLDNPNIYGNDSTIKSAVVGHENSYLGPYLRGHFMSKNYHRQTQNYRQPTNRARALASSTIHTHISTPNKAIRNPTLIY